MILLSFKLLKKLMNDLLNKEIKLKCKEINVLFKFEMVTFHDCMQKL